MTEQTTITPVATTDPVEPRSVPENLAETAEALSPPNQLEARERGRTDMIVWSLIGLVIVGGLATMALTWREVALPAFDALSFETPRLEGPWEDFGRPDNGGAGEQPNVMTPEAAPEGMTADGGADAEPVAQSDKPASE